MVKLKQTAMRASGVALAFAVLASPLAATAATNTSTTTVTATVGETISVNSSGNVALTLNPGTQAVLSSGSDSVTVATNDVNGFVLTLENGDTTTSLSAGGSDPIEASAHLPGSPQPLTVGTWGYAVAGGSFGTSYSVETNATTSSSLWAGVPVSGAGNQIASSGISGSVNLDVWYAARVGSSQPTGAYSDTVTYTATTQ